MSKLEKKRIKLINNIWLPFGIIVAFFTIFSGLYGILIGLLCFVSLILIPFGTLYITAGIALLKMTKLVLRPIGLKVVSKKQAYASAVANELDKRAKANV